MLTEEQYQQAFIQAKESFDFYHSLVFVNQPEYLAENRKNYCNSVSDKYALYDMTVMNNKFSSAYQDQMELRVDRQHFTDGVDREILKVMCFPTMKVLNKEGRWVKPE